MTMLLLCASLAFATSSADAPAASGPAHRWDGVNADITATGLIPADPLKTFDYLLDLRHWPNLFPQSCVGRIEYGDRSYGEGASAIVRYDMELMHRKLPVTLTHADAPKSVEFDHLGKLGFTTRWSLSEASGGTQVTIQSPLNPPPKPLRGYYYTVVQAEWTACYETALANLARNLAG